MSIVSQGCFSSGVFLNHDSSKSCEKLIGWDLGICAFFHFFSLSDRSYFFSINLRPIHKIREWLLYWTFPHTVLLLEVATFPDWGSSMLSLPSPSMPLPLTLLLSFLLTSIPPSIALSFPVLPMLLLSSPLYFALSSSILILLLPTVTVSSIFSFIHSSSTSHPSLSLLSSFCYSLNLSFLFLRFLSLISVFFPTFSRSSFPVFRILSNRFQKQEYRHFVSAACWKLGLWGWWTEPNELGWKLLEEVVWAWLILSA